MEFDLDLFTSELRNVMYESADFPYENDELNLKKHKKRPLHIKDVAFKANSTIKVSETTRTFDIGNTYAEQEYPYYHILQDSPVIRKKGRGTDKTRGSQAKVKNLGQRDYGKVSFNGKTYSREYAKNVRGARKSVVDNASRYENGKLISGNPRSLSYYNKHYKYIDKVLDLSVKQVASMFGGIVRTSNSGLKDDYNESKLIESMINSYLE